MNLEKIFFVVLALILLMGAETVAVNAQTQKQDEKKTEKKDDDDDDDKYDTPQMQKKLAKQAKITLEEARQKALERVPGTVLESELDKEKGRIVYEFEIRDKDNKIFEVLVDAKTGEIIEVEEETDEDDTDNSQVTRKKELKWFTFWRIIPGLSKL